VRVWQTIKGATKLSYTTPKVKAGWDKRQYRAAVKNAAGKQATKVVTLIVKKR